MGILRLPVHFTQKEPIMLTKEPSQRASNGFPDIILRNSVIIYGITYNKYFTFANHTLFYTHISMRNIRDRDMINLIE